MRTPEYHSWMAMRTRCLWPKFRGFQYYGGRGITICERWSDYAAFLEDMGPRPPGTSLDRIDGSGNYEPSNCKWSTTNEQCRNRRTVLLTVELAAQIRAIAADGDFTAPEIGKALGVSRQVITEVLRGETWN